MTTVHWSVFVPDLGGARVGHDFERQHHAFGTKRSPVPGVPKAGHMRFFMHRPADPMAAVLPNHMITGFFHDALHLVRHIA